LQREERGGVKESDPMSPDSNAGRTDAGSRPTVRLLAAGNGCWARRLTLAVCWLVTGGLAVTAVSAQTILSDPKKIADAENLFETFRGNELGCEVMPVRPHFIFSLRMQAGYICQLPLTMSQVRGQQWLALTRITPQAGKRSAVYLSDRVRFSAGGNQEPAAIARGSYWLGEGRYSVEFLMADGGGDACRSKWQIDARLKPAAHNFRPMLAPGTASGSWATEAPAQAAKPLDRMTILLHAASLMQLQTLIGTMAQEMLLDGTAALIGEMPARSVRLVVFNLEQQKELLRKEGFTLAALPEVAQALNAVQPATVDYRSLQNPHTAADFVEKLVNTEIHAAEPSDAVVFLGPRSIYKDKPSPDFGLPPGAKQHFFYLVCAPTGMLRSSRAHATSWGAQSANVGLQPFPVAPTYQEDPILHNTWTKFGPHAGPDSIEFTVDRLRGKTMMVDSVESFADAVAEISRMLGAGR